MEFNASVYEWRTPILSQPFSADSDEEAVERMKAITPFYDSPKTVVLYRKDGEQWNHVSTWSYHLN